MPLTEVDARILQALTKAFDAGADLIEPSDLVLLPHRSTDEVEHALVAMRRHRPQLFRAVVEADGRVIAITGITAAGRYLARTPALEVEAPAEPGETRDVSLRRRSLRIVVQVVVAVVVRVISDHLPFRD